MSIVPFQLPPTAQEYVGRFLRFLRSKYYRDHVQEAPTDQQVIDCFEEWISAGEPA